MNSVVLVGRLTKDPELRFIAGSGKAVANFSMAVDREFSKEKKADFFKVVVWGKQAEHVANYITKGRLVAVRGSLQTGSYDDKNNVKHYTTDIVAQQVQFLDYAKKQETDTNFSSDHNDEFKQVDEFKQEDFSDFATVSDDETPF